MRDSSRRDGRQLPARTARPPAERGPGLLDALRLRAENVVSGLAAGAQLETLERRSSLADARLQAEEREARLDAARELLAAGLERERALLRWAAERESLLLQGEHSRSERARLCRDRLLGGRSESSGPDPAVQVAADDRLVERAASRSAACLGQLEPGEARSAWEQWKQAVLRRCPANLAEEVIHRAAELLGFDE